MKFTTKDVQEDRNSVLMYRDEDYGFDTVPIYEAFTSLMVNDLQLEINEDGEIMHVWGYCPLIEYKETKEFPQEYQTKCLVALLDEPPIPGISYRINKTEEYPFGNWPIYINKTKGWVCIGTPKTEGKQLIEFAANSVAALEDQEIVAVWLRPEQLPERLRNAESNDADMQDYLRKDSQ